jgi:hypothetical protein
MPRKTSVGKNSGAFWKKDFGEISAADLAVISVA